MGIKTVVNSKAKGDFIKIVNCFSCLILSSVYCYSFKNMILIISKIPDFTDVADQEETRNLSLDGSEIFTQKS